MGDFNGDGAADILWRNDDDGFNVVWFLDEAGQVVGTEFFPAVDDDDWQLVSFADFNGDGNTDLLWRNDEDDDDDSDSGAVRIWLLDDTSVIGEVELPSVRDDDWTIIDVADFNADGTVDLLWRNRKSGDNVVWFLNAQGQLAGSGFMPRVSDRRWEMIAAADLTGDAKADLVWRNSYTGQIAIWEMNGVEFVAARSLSVSVVDYEWEIAEVLDFTGDGKADVLWRNAFSGDNVIWIMDGLTVAGSASLPSVDDDAWYIAGMDDYRDDDRHDDFLGSGVADLVWRNDATGQVLIWIMSDDDTIGEFVELPTVADDDWQIQGLGDVNYDAKPDIIWRNTQTGANLAWLMAGTEIGGVLNLPSVPGAWTIAGLDDADDDGIDDIFWRNESTGDNVVWILDGEPEDNSFIETTVNLPRVADTSWKIAGVRDLDDDGDADIFWRRDTGENVCWELDDSQITRSIQLPTVSDPNWQIGKISDVNDDDVPDLLWRNDQTGDNSVWVLDDDDADLYTTFEPFIDVDDTNWQIED